MQTRLSDRRFSTPANAAACRRSIQQGSRSFFVASKLLPVAIREPAYAVYAFCRMADDLIDRDGAGEAGVAEISSTLDRIYAGQPDDTFVERAFADVANGFAIPRAIPDALVEGLAWDAAGRNFASLADLEAYAVRVAGTVGIMMTLVMGRRDPETLARACDLGVAMQLTNICRDIGEDARNGRIYMPTDWLARDGVDMSAFLGRPYYSPAVKGIVEALLAEADGLYDRSLDGIAALPAECRTGINAARLIYRAIGEEVRGGINPVTERARTSGTRKLALVAEALASPTRKRSGERLAPLASARLLIEIAACAAAPAPPSPLPAWWAVGARAERMVEMLAMFRARDAGRSFEAERA